MSYLLCCILLCLPAFFICCLSAHLDDTMDIIALNVGEELERETLPLQMGERIYQLHGLKESVLYEVKISYPASIPASFTIQLRRGVPNLWFNKNRRLLNTEKVIFKYDSQNLDLGHEEMYALVTVKPEGVVAKAGVNERENVLFNIVCDELTLGIPHKAWWVGIAAILCLVLASIVPRFLPPHFLPKNHSLQPANRALSKSS